MGKEFYYTQHTDGSLSGWPASLQVDESGWTEASSVVGRSLAIFLCWLRLSARFLPYLVGNPFALERFLLKRRRHLRWWSFGAFGSKGRQEGGQYLAGRRAPPPLHW